MAQEALPLDERARRFLFRRRIGEGAFGVVWEAYDTERGARVALKALTRTEPSSLFLFKREFRALADIAHPNLVTLYELLSYGERWFFTMEFIEGVDFIEHLRGISDAPRRSRGTDTLTILRSGPVQSHIDMDEDSLDSGVTFQSPQDRPTLDGGILLHAGPWYDQPTDGARDAERHRGGRPPSRVRDRAGAAAPPGGKFAAERARRRRWRSSPRASPRCTRPASCTATSSLRTSSSRPREPRDDPRFRPHHTSSGPPASTARPARSSAPPRTCPPSSRSGGPSRRPPIGTPSA